VGNIMSSCNLAGVPCHRVVAAGGGLGGYGRETALKRALLRAEGVIVVGNRIRRWREVRILLHRQATNGPRNPV
jgi:alkylated DNA nucleotide flippase Atl1